MFHARWLLLALLLVAGCNSSDLRYQPVRQPDWAHLYADYHELESAIGIVIDTDGRRLEDIFITKPDGSAVRPLNITYPSFGRSGAVGSGVGFGTGGGVGLGLGVGVPVGSRRAQGFTTATFDKAAVGPAPWLLHLKVQGIDATTIHVGGPTTK